MGTPLAGCNCVICEAARAEQTKAWPVKAVWDRDRFGIGPTPFVPEPGNPFKASVQELYECLSKIAPVPFEPEPAAPEPVYTHVLLDYDEDGPMSTYAELHTAESLLGAIEERKDREGRYQVYKLGTLILDVFESE